MKEMITKAELLEKNRRLKEAREAARKQKEIDELSAAACEACKIEEKQKRGRKPASRKYLVIDDPVSHDESNEENPINDVGVDVVETTEEVVVEIDE